MKHIQKLIALLLAAMLLLTCLAGCQSGEDAKTTDTQKQENTVPDVPLEDADPFGKYETPITITSVRDLPNPSVVKYPDGDDITNNVWIRTISEELGINVEYLWTVDSSQLATRINAMIMGGAESLPDFFMATAAQYQELKEADLLYDLSEVYEAYASDYVKEVMAMGGENLMSTVTHDGKMTAIPTVASKEFGPMLWIRTDWLKNLGLDEPENLDDVLEIAEAFALNDPDGNGQDDTWGIAVNGDTTGSLYWHLGFFNSMGSYPTIWVEDGNGELVYGSLTEETKEALKTLNDLYNKKVIDPEFITKDYWAMYDPISAGKYGIVYGPYYASMSPIQPVVSADPNADWKAFPLLGEDGIAGMQQGVPVSGYYVVKKDCEHPEAVIKLLNFWYREFYQSPDMERYNKMVNDGGEYTSIYSSTPIQSLHPFANLDSALVAKQAFDGEITEDEIPPIGRQMYSDVTKYLEGDREMWMWNAVYQSLIDVMQIYRDQDLIVCDQNWSPPGDAMTSYFANLYAREMEYFTKIISGALPLDAFDEFVAEWKSTGGDEITAEVNAWYTANQ